jgi:AcrR family transcriptional regulator
MTVKKDTILQIALELFSNMGYANTSTNRIAKKAKVSEGLIFRHFTNKEGLLDAIVAIGTQSIDDYLLKMQNEMDSKKVISLAIEFPLNIMNENSAYWNLVTSLKYQSPEIAAKYHNSETFTRINKIIENAFTNLSYHNPEMETKYLFLSIMGLSSMYKQNHNKEELVELVSFIKSKYQI